jgi:predicted ATPase
MLDRVDIQDFGCIRDTTVALTAIHALIGPNDSGKSTVLRALLRAANAVRNGSMNDNIRAWSEGRWSGRRRGQIAERHVTSGVGNPAIVRWVPESLRRVSPNLTDVSSFLLSGVGLPGMLSRTFTSDDTALSTLNARLSATFPSIAKMRVEPNDAQGWRIAVTLQNGQRVSVDELSDGVLYWLAFESLRYLEDEWLLLLEEPENGLHPSRIAEVMATIKHVVAKSNGRIQVVMATHSPLVINELEPDQVTLVTRDVERGTQVTPMRQTKNFEERSKVYALGELWLSYANGRDEVELMPTSSGAP